MTWFAYVCRECGNQEVIDHARDDTRTGIKCPWPDCTGTIRKDWSSAQVTPSSMPSRRNDVAPRTIEPQWEKGIVTVDRAGYRLPLIHANSGRPIRVKEYQDNRSRFEQARRDTQNRPAPAVKD